MRYQPGFYISIKIYNNKYKNKIFPNNSQIHIRDCDAVSEYCCAYPIIGSKIKKLEFILNCCLESSKHIDRFSLVHVIN